MGMIENNEKMTGEKVSKEIHKIVPLTDLIGVPIVIVFFMYNLSGSFGAFMANLGIFIPLLVVATVLIVISVLIFRWSLNRDIRKTIQFRK